MIEVQRTELRIFLFGPILIVFACQRRSDSKAILIGEFLHRVVVALLDVLLNLEVLAAHERPRLDAAIKYNNQDGAQAEHRARECPVLVFAVGEQQAEWLLVEIEAQHALLALVDPRVLKFELVCILPSHCVCVWLVAPFVSTFWVPKQLTS